jgi:methionine S-methyltransferase
MPHKTPTDILLSSFLSTCKISSEKAIYELSTLVQKLENKSTQKEGVKLLISLVDFFEDKPNERVKDEFHFQLFDMEIPNGLQDNFRLKLFQLPSTFAPEEWSFTFFEGLCRYPFSEFGNKEIVELGCGNGWISLSIALRYNCEKIDGLDINPKAILCSKLNLYLNAFDRQGELIVGADGRSLLDKVEFHVSDLLSYFYPNRTKRLDVIIGCIPQVLAPEESIDNARISADANDEFLHSLSNYTSEQGYVEDKFGLGLIARSVEEGIDFLKPDGKLILNLGERPRREVLERLVKRRGLLIHRIWKRKVAQANDTDIDSLVRLEREMNHHFEFYTDLHSDAPINARTAKLFASKGGIIYHNLSVYECTFDYYSEIKLLFQELKNELFAEAKVGLDLDYLTGSQKEEKIRFLAELVKKLRLTDHFPYEDNQGELLFRKSIAAFLAAYQHVDFSERNIFVSPNLESLVENIIDVYQPAAIFLSDSLFSNFVQKKPSESYICTPNCSRELNDLIERIQPEIVVAKVGAESTFTQESFRVLMGLCEQAHTRLFIDISECFDLSSSPESNGVFQYLVKTALPLHVSLICELSKNQIYSDLKTCFMISNNSSLIGFMRNAAEFSYSRSPYLSQLFYTILVKELTSFHMKVGGSAHWVNTLSEESPSFARKFIGVAPSVKESFEHAAIKGNELQVDSNTVRFDYGENELACPDDLKISILESFTRQSFSDEECDPQQQISAFVKTRFGLTMIDQIVYGNGVAPIFSGLLKIIKEQGGTLLIPEGSYGYFCAAARFYGVNMHAIATRKENNFRLTRKELEVSLAAVENPWLFLNFPLVNPTGAFWEEENMRHLLKSKGIENTTLIVDTVFSGLEFNGGERSTLFSEFENNLKIVFLGGVSKEYSAGGIRFGYSVTNFPCNLNQKLMFTPHSTVKYTVKKLLSKYLEGDDRIKQSLEAQVEVLKVRADRLSVLLRKYGWDVITPAGGLFLVARPDALIGKKLKCSFQDGLVEVDASTISLVLHDQINLLINNQDWTNIKGYCRFVLSVNAAVFEEGMKRLEEFHLRLLIQ